MKSESNDENLEYLDLSAAMAFGLADTKICRRIFVDDKKSFVKASKSVQKGQNQHTLGVSFMRRFSIEGENDQIYQYSEKHFKKSPMIKTSLKKAGNVKNIYQLHTRPPKGGDIMVPSAENSFAKIEDKFAKDFNKLSKEEFIKSETIIDMLIVQYIRSVYNIKKQTALLNQINLKSPKGVKPPSLEEIRLISVRDNLLRDEKYLVTNAPLSLIISELSLLPIIQGLSPFLLEVPEKELTSGRGFILSDNPVLLLEKDNRIIFKNKGIVKVIFPLSTSLCLFLLSKDSRTKEKINIQNKDNVELINRVNELSFKNHSDSVFGSTAELIYRAKKGSETNSRKKYLIK